MGSELEFEGCTTAEELLEKFGRRNMFMEHAIQFLTNDVFMNDMMASCDGVCFGTRYIV